MVSIDDIQKLREETKAPVMECKKALEKAQGDTKKAKEILRKQGEIRAEKKQGVNTKAGIIEAYIHSNKQVGVLLELRCETDFVAKNPDFKDLAHDLAMQVAATKPLFVSEKNVPQEIIEKKKKDYEEELEKEGKPKEILEKIITGKLEKDFEEMCLEKQKFIKDESKNVGDLVKEAVAKFGEKIEIGEFARFQI
ncbi:MAG: elongation factor Ts [Candidatus Paceibacterota bacterium]|jgi:elongation factor Ts|nr:elongation factor Ts [Candidatus Paceibacterota bacterium]MDD3548344.1 elongation factor Ts [Candidatus Paceibacterota bacterium]MDD4998896.1 elongation factor Ts [Candidatus Paceibacterota bacterium]MDD5545129.1 elongation factor Ts [Candidatus Paceibacterota bacterium]